MSSISGSSVGASALCPTFGLGEFWRWPKYHKDHDPTGWVCWFCFPPPQGSGPCDFCGVPERLPPGGPALPWLALLATRYAEPSLYGS
jgi:hypothetical protein